MKLAQNLNRFLVWPLAIPLTVMALSRISVAAPNTASGPVPETVPAKIVFMNMSATDTQIYEPQIEIAEALPKSMRLLINTTDFTDRFIPARLKGAKIVAKTEIIKFADSPVSSWARDFSPVLAIDRKGKPYLAQFRYNQYEEGADVTAQAIAKKLKLPLKKINLIFEPGNLMVDSSGTAFVTERVLFGNSKTVIDRIKSATDFSMNLKNPPVARSRAEAEKLIVDGINAKRLVWLKDFPVATEGTGHIDLMAKIISNDTAVVADSADRDQKAILDLAEDALRANGFKKIVRIMNGRSTESGRLLSYTNALLLGSTILIPRYGQPTDADAVKAYESLGFKVKSIDGQSIHLGGSVHCLTYQY